jgi:pyruvate kinase
VSPSRIETKRTKIVATLGPSSSDEAIIRQMIRAGMDVARINFSHGDHPAHGQTVATVRRIAHEEGAVVAIMCDIQGPKIRIGKVPNEPLLLAQGEKITLALNGTAENDRVIPLPHPEFIHDIKPETHLLLDDGQIELVVRQVTDKELVCEVLVGGPLSSRKGVMAPNARLSLSAITEKDREDIQFALAQNADFIAMSFVRSENDLRELRWLIKHLGGSTAAVAKIEKHEALENIEGIIEASDAVMVARGDLGLEIPPQEVPRYQKEIIRRCNAAGKPVITATQMLNSMVDNPRPTRAEASDVYNAILDGSDAVMLSNETASGHYPVEAVDMMAHIATIAEERFSADRLQDRRVHTPDVQGREAISDAVAQAACEIAEALNAKALVTLTLTGYTTRRVAKERPRTPILCITPSEVTLRRMALTWGVLPLLIPQFKTMDEMTNSVVRTAYDAKLVERGDSLVIIAGVPFGIGGQTNFLKIHLVGELGEL